MGKAVIILIVFFAMFSHFVQGQERRCRLRLRDRMKQKWSKFQENLIENIQLDVTLFSGCDEDECVRPLNVTRERAITDNRTGCRCESQNVNENMILAQCRCCFRINRWNALICLAGGFDIMAEEKFFVLYATLDGTIVERIRFSLASLPTLQKTLCVPLLFPPPMSWLSPCFRTRFNMPSPMNNNSWEICGKFKLGIFLWSVVTIYAKCFQISRSLDELRIAGQTDPKQNVEDAAEVQIDDLENAIACSCAFNKKKYDKNQCGVSRRSGDFAGAVCPRPVRPVEQTDKQNWAEAKLDQSPFLVLLHHDKNNVPVSEELKDMKFDFIREALQVAASEQWMDHSEKNYDSPGSSCGGALLTADKVLTVCACVRSFYMVNKLQMEPEEDVEYLYDIRANEIILKIPSIPEGRYMLDPDGSKIMGDSMCATEIKNNETEKTQTTMVVMPFTPALVNPADVFVNWPPLKVPDSNRVNMVAYGLTPRNTTWFWNKDGKRIDFDETAVEFFITKCELTPYAKGELEKTKPMPPEDLERLSGFCAESSNYQLCDGEVGFPLTVGRDLVGLNSVPLDCNDKGSVAGTVFSDAIIKEIEDYVGKDNLHPRSGGSTAVPGSSNNPRTSPRTNRRPTRPRVTMERNNTATSGRNSYLWTILVVATVSQSFH